MSDMNVKNNYFSIIIAIVIAIILLSVLPILTNISKECPPCENSVSSGNSASSDNSVSSDNSEPIQNYIKFVSDSPRTITPKFTQSGVTLQYSIDNGSTWNNISSGVATASSDEIWFRGQATDKKSLYTSDDDSNAWVFSGNASNKLHVYGDLRYLLCDNLGDNTITFNIDSYCFTYMFYGCTSLTTPPSLPATTLADRCYQYMFYGCSALTTAPELPALTLADRCYQYMFNRCTNLTTAPELPATTMANYCYYGMFYNCSALTTAPELPATTMADYCYSHMFAYCTALTTAPKLPATTMADYCYSHMFAYCTSFKVLNTKTGSYQHSWRIPTSGMGTTATEWNENMLTSTGGPFKSNPTINTTYYVENPPV